MNNIHMPYILIYIVYIIYKYRIKNSITMPKYKKNSKTNTEKKNPLNRRKRIPANVVKNFHKLYSQNKKKLHRNMLENGLSENIATGKISIELRKKEPN